MKRVLVTGATGFLGGHVARTIHQLGYRVTATGRNAVKGEALQKEGITFVRGELADEASTVAMCAGQDVVIHCGALSSAWGPYRDFYDSNVIGTKHVITGCQRHDVQRLVYISTPSIYVDFTDRINVTETEPLPRKASSAYAATKRLAEEEVDRAFAAGLPVVTLRPRAIFGPGDQAILPRLLQANRQGRIPIMDGGQAFIDLTYVDNAVSAIIQSMSSSTTTLGRKYNVTNGEPLPLIDLLQRLFAQLGEPMRSKKISYRLAYTIAAFMEGFANCTRSSKEPILTRQTVAMLGKSLTLDITAAREELNYSPKVSIDEGIAAYVKWYQQQTQRSI